MQSQDIFSGCAGACACLDRMRAFHWLQSSDLSPLATEQSCAAGFQRSKARLPLQEQLYTDWRETIMWTAMLGGACLLRHWLAATTSSMHTLEPAPM